MARTVSEKMGLKEGSRAIFINVPESARDAIDPPNLVLADRLGGEFDYIHLFVTSRDELDEMLPKLREYLKPTGTLWISWPKAKQLETDLALPRVIDIGYSHGFVESKCLSVDSTWSALKFTHPREGKIYNNKYGQLPSSKAGGRRR